MSGDRKQHPPPSLSRRCTASQIHRSPRCCCSCQGCNQLLPPSPLPTVPTTHVYLSPPPFLSSHCSAATTSRRWWAYLSPLTLAAESPGRRDVENKYLKGGGTQLSQMCRNRHSIPPSEANVSKARGLLFVFSSEALCVVY